MDQLNGLNFNKGGRITPTGKEKTMLNLKNKNEREAFISDYKNWTENDGVTKRGIWRAVPELNLDFYRYEFANGAVLIVTEYKEYKTVYEKFKSAGKKYVTEHRYCLVLTENDDYTDDSYATSGNYYKTYTLNGCSFGAVINYMTKNRLCL